MNGSKDVVALCHIRLLLTSNTVRDTLCVIRKNRNLRALTIYRLKTEVLINPSIYWKDYYRILSMKLNILKKINCEKNPFLRLSTIAGYYILVLQ